MSHRLTTEEWVERAVAVHGDRYDYSEVKYVGNRTKVVITCKSHGGFQQVPYSHINGNGCPGCSGTKTPSTSEFIDMAKKVHGDRYGYQNVLYTTGKTKITIKCNLHGDFLQEPRHHVSGHGCPKCGRRCGVTTGEWVEKAIMSHGDRYDYSESVYVNSKTKITINCSVHGDFWQTPGNHTSGKGCPKCVVPYRHDTSNVDSGVRRLTTKNFIEKAIFAHGDTYKYDKVNYVNNSTKIVIGCGIHGDFLQSPGHHMKGRGCPECGYISSREGIRFTTDEFIHNSEKKHPNKYTYDKVDYVNSITKVTITCPKHGDFEQTPGNHTSGKGCPSCARAGFDSNKQGFLYILYCALNNTMKIGISNKPEQRHSQLSSNTPFQFTVLHSIPMQGKCARIMETHTHKRCISANLKGFDGATEWFEFDQSIIDELVVIGDYV